MQWCLKYRKPIFADKAVKQDCEQALYDAAEAIGVQLAELAVMQGNSIGVGTFGAEARSAEQ